MAQSSDQAFNSDLFSEYHCLCDLIEICYECSATDRFSPFVLCSVYHPALDLIPTPFFSNKSDIRLGIFSLHVRVGPQFPSGYSSMVVSANRRCPLGFLNLSGLDRADTIGIVWMDGEEKVTGQPAHRSGWNSTEQFKCPGKELKPHTRENCQPVATVC